MLIGTNSITAEGERAKYERKLFVHYQEGYFP